MLSVPDGVDVRKVDLSIELQILAFHEQRKAGEEAAANATPHSSADASVSGDIAETAAGSGAAPAAAVEPPAGRPAAVARKSGPEGDVPAVMPA